LRSSMPCALRIASLGLRCSGDAWLVEAALKAREQEEPEQRLTDLEDALSLKQGHKSYGV
jgi:hypothetical protein